MYCDDECGLVVNQQHASRAQTQFEIRSPYHITIFFAALKVEHHYSIVTGFIADAFSNNISKSIDSTTICSCGPVVVVIVVVVLVVVIVVVVVVVV